MDRERYENQKHDILASDASLMSATLYLFDLDGTLSDSLLGIRRCLDYALERCGYSAVAESDISHLIGAPLDQVLRSIVNDSSPDRIAALVSKYRERYAEVGYAENEIYPGVADALRTLHSANIPMAICTSKRADLAELIVKRFDIRQYFRFISGDIGVQKSDRIAALVKDGVIPKSSMMIGDRAVDILAAKANGLHSAGVLWGYGSLAELQAVCPDAMLEYPHELLALAKVA